MSIRQIYDFLNAGFMTPIYFLVAILIGFILNKKLKQKNKGLMVVNYVGSIICVEVIMMFVGFVLYHL